MIERRAEFKFLLFNILRKNADNATSNDVAGIELCGCNTFDRFTQAQKLRLSFCKGRASSTRKIVHRGGADLTFDRRAVLQHRKYERHSFDIVAQNPAPRQRHRKLPPNSAYKMRRPAGFV